MATRLHPEIQVLIPYLEKIAVCLAGDSAVKAEGTKYLSMTSGQANGGTKGTAAYDAYKSRAIYHNFPKETLRSMLGLMWREWPVFEMPDKMDPFYDQITPDGLGVDELLQKINREQLTSGRIGILVDLKTGTSSAELPYIVTYDADDIVNWFSEFRNGEEVVTSVVLDETRMVMDDNMAWEQVEKYRVLLLKDEKFVTYVANSEGEISLTPPADAVTPMFGGKPLNRIPFFFCNASCVGTETEIPPLSDLCDLSLALYRLEADYRQALFMQGQATPYATGVSKNEMDGVKLGCTGLLTSDNPQAVFGFLELSGAGLGEMRTATDNLKADCIRLGVSLIEQGQVESGVALKTRVSSKTALLTTVAQSGAKALESALKTIAEWIGLNAEKVSLEPNLDFSDDTAVAADFVSLMSAKTMGAPISLESIHAYAREKGYTELEFDDEMEIIAGEAAPQRSITQPEKTGDPQFDDKKKADPDAEE